MAVHLTLCSSLSHFSLPPLWRKARHLRVNRLMLWHFEIRLWHFNPTSVFIAADLRSVWWGVGFSGGMDRTRRGKNTRGPVGSLGYTETVEKAQQRAEDLHLWMASQMEVYGHVAPMWLTAELKQLQFIHFWRDEGGKSEKRKVSWIFLFWS